MRIFLRIFVSFWVATIVVIAISPLLLSTDSSPLQDDRLRSLPLSDLQSCAKTALERYQHGGSEASPQQDSTCHQGILLGPKEVPLANLSGKKLSAAERHLVRQAEGGKSVLMQTLPTKTLVALPADASSSPYIYLATVPLSTRQLFLSYFQRLGRLALVAGVFSCLLTAYFVRPIARLGHVAEQFGHGDLKVRVHPSLSRRKDELGELGRTFNQMASRIESLVDRYRNFLAHASHELGSPLTRLNLSLALAKRKAGPQLEHELNRIGSEADRLNSLVQELLLLARLESGNELSRDVERFEVATLVEDACADARFEAKQFHKSVTIVRSEPFQLLGHQDLLRRALDNVLRNGLRFARSEGCVRVSYYREIGPDTGVILIQDDGPGVLAGQEETIFEPFVTLPNQTSDAIAGGSGLGLAIARQAVLANHGTISAHQRPGEGLIVRIELPVTTKTNPTHTVNA